MSQSIDSLTEASFLSSIRLPVAKFWTIPSLVLEPYAILALTVSLIGILIAPVTNFLS